MTVAVLDSSTHFVAGRFGAQCGAARAIGIALCCVSGSIAEHPPVAHLRSDLSLDQYTYREWTTEDGLPSDQVADITQTRDGYLWLATERGLARFDGVTFTLFNRSNTSALVTNQITHLYESPDGTLWIGTHRGGLIRYRSDPQPEFHHFAELDGHDIQCLCEDGDGTLWIGTEAETWTVADGKCAPRRDAPLNVRALCKDEHGTLWLGASIWMHSRPESHSSSGVEPRPGLYRLVDASLDRLTEADGIPQTESDSSVVSLCSDRSGGLWIGTLDKPLLHYRDGKCEDLAVALGPKASQYLQLHQDRGGQLWIATYGAGFYRLVGNEATRVGNRLRPVRCIAEDREGNIWFGGGRRGLRCISNPPLAVVKHTKPGVAVLRCLIQDSAGDLWLGSGNPGYRKIRNFGLHRFRNGDFEDFGVDHGLPTSLVTGLSAGPDGRIWIGTNKGLACRSDGEIRTYTTDDGLGRNWIRAVYADSKGVVWIGFWEGTLQRFHDGVFTTIGQFGDADVNWFHEDAGGVLWIGSNRGLYRWHDEKLQRVRDEVLDRLPTIGFTACFEDDEGHLWIGTDGGGLCRYIDGRFTNWTSEHGLYEDRIHAIAEDTRGRLWLGGPHGLTSLRKQSLRDFEASQTSAQGSSSVGRIQVAVHPIGQSDVQARIGADYQPKVVGRDDGSLWFITSEGVAIVPPDGPHQHPIPPLVHVEDIRIGGESRGVTSTFELLSGARHIDFVYTANTFVAPERVRFQYRLDGFDDDWIDAGTARSASYTDVPPGNYVFRVKADNGDDVWSDEHAVIGLTVTPRWWEVGWLRALALLASIAAVIGYFRHRMREVREANAVLRREISDRKRAEEASHNNFEQLARVSRAASIGELTTSIAHEVKQPLYAIVSNAQTATRILEDDHADLSEAREALSDIASAGNQAAEIIDHIRSLVRKEHPSKDQLDLNEVVVDAIKLVHPELRKRSLVIRTELAETLPAVHGDPVELQQVILNLIINGAQAMTDGEPKSSASPDLLVTTSTHNGSVELAVTDSGTGLNETEAKQMFEPFYTTKPDGTGMGLAINRTIIEAHGGRIWAESNADRGATFHFCLPVSSGNSK